MGEGKEERMNLYEQEKRVGEYYSNIGEVVRSAWKIKEMGPLLRTFTEQIGQRFGWHTTAIILKEGSRLHLGSYYRQQELYPSNSKVSLGDDNPASADPIFEAVRRQAAVPSAATIDSFPELNAEEGSVHGLALPLLNRDALIGVLVMSRADAEFDPCEIEILGHLAEHVSLAIDNVRLYEQNEQLLLEEERNRLARDLHDSVNQKLFSLSLLAQGLRARLRQEDHAMEAGLREIGELVQEALSEMKSLIWGLHSSSGRNATLGELLERHAAKLGLKLSITNGRQLRFSERIEEALWRVGQEALNNVRKHASSECAELEIACDDRYVRMRITDGGAGFGAHHPPSGGLGLISMRERVQQLNGMFGMNSSEGKGTTIEAAVPLASEGKV